MNRVIFNVFVTCMGVCWLLPEPAAAQNVSADEIIVTGTRMKRAQSFKDIGGAPGVTFVKRGDFLLLEVQIESDARQASERRKEIAATIEAFLEAAETDPSIEMSILESGTTVRRLTRLN